MAQTSFKIITNVIRDTANLVNPTGRFIPGRVIDAATEYKGKYPLIHLYPFTTVEDDDGVFDTADILMAFWLRDIPDKDTSKLEALVNAMAIMSKQFTERLKTKKDVRITRITKEPQFRMLPANLSGYALRFSITVPDLCSNDWMAELPSEYLEGLGQ